MSQQWEWLWRDGLSHLGSTLSRENLIFEAAGGNVWDLQAPEVTHSHEQEQVGAGRRSECPGDAAGILSDASQLWHCCWARASRQAGQGSRRCSPALGSLGCAQCHEGMPEEQGFQPGSREWPSAGAAPVIQPESQRKRLCPVL